MRTQNTEHRRLALLPGSPKWKKAPIYATTENKVDMVMCGAKHIVTKMDGMQFLDTTEFQKQILKNGKVHVNAETVNWELYSILFCPFGVTEFHVLQTTLEAGQRTEHWAITYI